MTGCGLIPKPAPYDSLIEEKTTELSLEYEKLVIELEQGYQAYFDEFKANEQDYRNGSKNLADFKNPGAMHATHKKFYSDWRPVLRHLVARSRILDLEDSCPFTKQVAISEQALARGIGDVGSDGLAIVTAALKPVDTTLDTMVKGLNNLNANLTELEKELATDAGSLTVEEVKGLESKIKRARGQRDALKDIAKFMKTVEIQVPEGSCNTIVVATLEKVFALFEEWHKAQGNIGISNRRKGMPRLVYLNLNNVLKVQFAKKKN